MGEELAVASLCEAFQATTARNARQVALRTADGATKLTWADYGERVRRLAGGLAQLGCGRGQTVALMMLNRPEFHVCDTAVLHTGAAPFSVYNTSTAEQIRHLLDNAGTRLAICESQFAPRLLDAGASGALEHVVCIDGAPDGTIAIEELEAAPADGWDFEASWRGVGGEDLLTLIYTSGTTGPPKGVEITHANMLAELAGTQAVIPARPGDRAISYLPAAHIADRWASHYQAMALGMEITCVSDPRAVAAALPDVRPTVWGAVPRVWEKLHAGVEAAIAADATLSGAVASGDERALAALRERIGLDQARVCVSGAAPVAVELLRFFASIGVEITELWGMSELSCCATINPPGAVRMGTVGVPIPGLELSLADDGELLCRGPIVMRGYRGEPARTAEAIDREGWLRTGDLARIDAEGYVTIVDRKKELIINAAGKNMSPANIEARLKAASRLVGQAIAIGDRRPYNVALLVLDPDACASFAAANGIGEHSIAALAGDERVREQVRVDVERANASLSRVEQIKRFEILAVDWLPDGDELTPTMKLKRRPIAAKYAAEIDALYEAS